MGLLSVEAGCGRRGRQTPDDTLVVLMDTPMKSADPRYCGTNNEVKLARLATAGLVALDTPDLRPRLDLAERIDRLDDVTFEVTLRPGLRFADGSPLEAADVVWSYQSVLDPGSDSLLHKGFVDRFAAVEELDPRRVRFRLTAPLATLMTDLEFGILSRRGAGPDGRFAGGLPLGAGPYRVTALSPAVVELERNPHYHGEPAALPRLELRVVRDATARILMLVGGSADLTQNTIRLDLVDDVARRDRVEVASGQSVLLTYLMMNNDDPVLADVRVRRAIALALDRPAIIAGKFSGRAQLATGLLPPAHWAYNGEVRRYPHDPAEARRLLDEAGFPDPDGDGPAPRLRLTYKTSSDAFRAAVARVIASQLGEVGIAVEVRPFEFATFFADVKRGSYQLASMQTSDITDPDYYFSYFHSSRIPTATDPDAGNRWRYRNPRVDELTAAGRRELDPERRRVLYAEVQALVADDVPVVPLWHEDNVVLSNREVQGYVIVPNARLGGVARTTKAR
ncbi:MAG: ABC transporter substrate-binding protein [Kofleriaceae bacterium]